MKSLLLLCLLFVYGISTAQNSYVNFGYGYNVFKYHSHRNVNIDIIGSDFSATGYKIDVTDVNLSKGVFFNLNYGYRIYNDFFLDLKYTRFFGSETEIKGITDKSATELTYKSTSHLFTPGIIYKNVNEIVHPIVGLGLIVYKSEVEVKNRNEFITTYSGGWQIGIESQIGIEYNATSNICVSFLLNYLNMEYKTDHMKVHDNLNGTEREYDLKDAYELKFSDPNSADITTATFLLNTIGISVGVSYLL